MLAKIIIFLNQPFHRIVICGGSRRDPHTCMDTNHSYADLQHLYAESPQTICTHICYIRSGIATYHSFADPSHLRAKSIQTVRTHICNIVRGIATSHLYAKSPQTIGTHIFNICTRNCHKPFVRTSATFVCGIATNHFCADL